jgi:hypothetical protein
MNWIKHPLEPRHLGVSSSASKTIFEPLVHSAQTMDLSCVKINTISNKLNQASTWASYLGVLPGASKMISKPTVCLAKTVHLSCPDTNTISNWTKTRYHMTHDTLEFHRVRPKWFLSLWYIRRKPCTYLVSRFAVSPNELNQASTSASSPRRTIRCIQNDFSAYGKLGANRAPILCQGLQYLQTNWIKHPLEPRHQGVPSGASKMISEPVVRSTQTLHLSYVKIGTISNKLNQASTWASSPWSTIRCVHNDFWFYGMFSTNHAPILNQH